ncbi:GH16894 [Drosophila grimshawi]|uniref:GH16894 n=1 Tax=Drosophila grimshawi TaxID=7222 RepID=B4IXL2_DROGR|nr:GH16894 [Drosophila grimshawi]
MLKIPQRNKPIPSLTTRTTKIERPTPRRKLNLLAIPIMPLRPTKSEEITKVTSELNARLVNLQQRVVEWKQLRGHH